MQDDEGRAVGAGMAVCCRSVPEIWREMDRSPSRGLLLADRPALMAPSSFDAITSTLALILLPQRC